MKNYLNMGFELTIMKRLFIVLVMLLSVLSLGYSYDTPQEILRYQFEEGTGSLILDTSGSDNHAVVDGGNWDNTAGRKAFGVYSYKLTNDDSIRMINTIPMFEQFTFLGTIFFENKADKNTIGQVYSGTNVYFQLVYDRTLARFEVSYLDSLNIFQTIAVPSSSMLDNTKHNIGLTYNSYTGLLKFYLDNNLKLNQSITPKNLSTSTINIIFGEKYDYTDGFKGNFDNFRVYNFELLQSEINQVITTNYFEVPETFPFKPEEPPINDTTTFNIINTYTPQTSANITNQDQIKVSLNNQSNCQLYIDYSLVKSYNDILGFSYDLNLLALGDHTYFVYCEFTKDSTLYFELLSIQSFTIISNPQTITFQITGTDFNVNDEDLFITTPCMNEGFSAIGTDYKPYRSEYNKGGINFAFVENGFASFNITGQENEYCLYNGRIIVNEEDKTTNYDPIAIYGSLDLGTILTPNNITSIYVLSVDKFEIYDKVNPKAWGQTWTGIIGGLILLVLGIVLLIGGLYAKEGKIVIGGVLLCLSAFGITINGLLGVLI